MKRKVAVVGGGLAGILSSLWLSEQGDEVYLYEEKEERDYSVNCGETLADVDDSRTLLPGIYENHIRNELSGVEYKIGDNSYKMSLHMTVLDRKEWQLELIDLAKSKDVNVSFGEKGRPYEFNNSYDLVVDARGSFRRENRDYAKAIYVICGGDFDPNKMILFNRECLAGYYWVIPYSKDIANIGYGGEKEENISLGDLRNLFNQVGVSNSDIVERGGGLLDYTYGDKLYQEGKKRDLVYENFPPVVEVGDAAGLVSPLTGIGINGAIKSAKLLSQNIGNLQRYQRKIYDTMGKTLSRSTKMAYIRKNNFSKFEDIIKILDGTKLPETWKKTFLLKHPIKAMRLGKELGSFEYRKKLI
ncbi:hypothetical protein C9439_05440 [archaeon SCG-AAA382B04]|nr:hypothetical protein C9439_05440 [archaeon SCG-AAA382B04]